MERNPEGWERPSTAVDLRLVFAAEDLSEADVRDILDVVRSAFDWSDVHLRSVEELDEEG